MKICNKAICIVIFILFTFIGFNITVLADTVILASEFEDNIFYQYVIENFDTNGDGMLQQSEAEAVEEINSEDATGKITSIKGIEYFTNLRALFIGEANENHDIKSIEPIRNLTKIYVLDIGENPQITDFSPVYGLNLLEYFNADETKINDISFLSNMKKLSNLTLSYCENITDFSVISELTELQHLNLHGEENFKDITLLMNLKQLGSLDLGNTDIVDFSMLAELENIGSLCIQDTDVKDIWFLKSMNNLQQLILYNCEQIEDFTVLRELTNLLFLQVSNSNTFPSEAQNLSSLKNLQLIRLGYNIEILPDMTDWTNLQYVSLGGNKITEEEAIAKLPAHITSQENWRETTGLIYQRHDEDEINENETSENETNNNINKDETLGNISDTRVITSVSDNNISAQGSFESDIYLEAKRIENTSDYDDLIKQVQSRLTDVIETSIYDIWLYKKEVKEGEDIRIKVQPDGSIKVMIKIEETEGVRYHVFRQEDDGTLTKLNCYVEDGTLIFYSEHFSIFTVVISRLLDDEEDTGNNTYNSDNTNYIKEPQQGINIPSLYETKSNGRGLTKTSNNIKNEDNDNNVNNNETNNENNNKDESSSTSFENGLEAANETVNKLNNDKLKSENDTTNSGQSNNIEGIAGIVVVVMVGVGLFGYDIMKRRRGYYMRNFQMGNSNTDLDAKQ